MAILPPDMRELAVKLARATTSVAVLTEAVKVIISTAEKENGVNANVDSSQGFPPPPPEYESSEAQEARRLQTPPPTQSPKRMNSGSPQPSIKRRASPPKVPKRRPARLLSPDTNRNRYRLVRKPKPVAIVVDDSDCYSSFLDIDDWDSDWSRQASIRRSPIRKRTRSNLGQTPVRRSRPSASVQSYLPSPPPSSDTLAELHFADQSEVPKPISTTPQARDKIWRPPGGMTSPKSRKRSLSISSTASSTSCYSTEDEQPTYLATFDPAQQLMEQHLRRGRREKRARKLGLPVPPPTPPPLPPPSSFLSATGLTIPGRDLKPDGRNAQRFLGNHGKLGQDKPPHIRRQLRLRQGESETPVVDILWHPSAALRYDRKDAITASLISKIARLARNHPDWRSSFTLQPPASAPTKVKKKRHNYDFGTEGTNCALKTRLASVFGISPYSPDLARAHLEKMLMPLVLANEGAFSMLKECNIWKPWEGWVVKP